MTLSCHASSFLESVHGRWRSGQACCKVYKTPFQRAAVAAIGPAAQLNHKRAEEAPVELHRRRRPTRASIWGPVLMPELHVRQRVEVLALVAVLHLPEMQPV